jgi:hypothetical protein
MRYGLGFQPGANVLGITAPGELVGKFIRVVVGTATEEEYQENPNLWDEWQWYGYIDIQGDGLEGSVTYVDEVPVGERQYVAYGLQRMLQDHLIRTSKVWHETAPYDVDVGLTFNDKGKPNRAKDKVGGEPYYRFAHELEEPEYWSTRDIIEYLFGSLVGVPVSDSAQNELLFVATTDELDKLPTWDTPMVETHLVPAKQVIDALINRRRLYTWWIDVTIAPNAALKVATFTDAVISIADDEQIPANDDQVAIDMRQEPTAIVLQTDRAHAVDQVIAYGARRRHVATTQFGISSADQWGRGWDQALVSDYNVAGSADPAFPAVFEVQKRQRFVRDARRREEFKSVFRRWVLKPHGSGLTYPPVDPDGYQMFWNNVTIENKLPLVEGLDASGNAIDSGNLVYRGEGPYPERPPLIIIERPSAPGKYVQLENIGTASELEVEDEDEVRDWSCQVRIDKDGKAMDVRTIGAPQHVLGFGEFTAQTYDEDIWGHWDWQTMQATVSFLDERYAEAVWPVDVTNRTTAVRTLRIPAGEQYKLDYIEKNTIVDLADDGTPILCTNDGWVNDDRGTLESIARMAYEWYSRSRVVVRMKGSYDTPCNQLGLGQYVASIQRWGTAEAVGSIITSYSITLTHSVGQEVTKELPPMRFSLTTAFGELDVVRLRGAQPRDRN